MDFSNQPGTQDRVTTLSDGRQVRTAELGPLLYEDLRRLADGLFRGEQPGVTLQPTALVHEVFLKLAAQDNQTFADRNHFLAVAATAMRRVLSNAARDRGRQKRGGGWERVTLSGQEVEAPVLEIDLLDLDEALGKIEQTNERYARIIELRFFAGLTLEEAGAELGISRRMVTREWTKAQAWLMTYLDDLADEA